MSRRLVLVGVAVVALAAVAGAVGFISGKAGYQSEVANARAQAEAREASRQERIRAAERALPRLEDYRRTLRESPGTYMQRTYEYEQAKNEGTTLPCGDKWKEFTYRFGVTRHYCTRGHAFKQTPGGVFVAAE